MSFKKAIFHTILFIFFLELIGIWILFVPDEIEFIKVSHLLDSITTLVLIVFISKSFKQFDVL